MSASGSGSDDPAPRPRRRRPVTPGDAQQWAEWLEQGQSVSQIARQEEHDPRTVLRAIDLVQAEVEIRAIRREAMKTAMAHHFDALLDTLGRIGKRASDPRTPSFDPPLPTREGAARIRPCGFDLSWSAEGEPVVRHSDEGTARWNMLKSHLAAQPVWNHFGAWRLRVEEVAVQAFDLLRMLVAALGSWARHGAGQDDEAIIEIPGLRLLFEAAVQQASGEGARVESALQALKRDEQGVRVEGRLLVSSPDGGSGSLEELREILLNERFQTRIDALAAAVEACRAEGAELATEIEFVTAVPYLGGECRACARLGT